MRIVIKDFMEINPKTNRGIKKRTNEYEAATEAEARAMHAARIEAGEIPAGARDGGWFIRR
ncbi:MULTISPECIES: hypothetical protein [unclassified Streptomyces]|uniref:hypothetical protein n=1 Tax=unclassified Streptomyces TaxID=2593676 RepID=UPI0004BED1E7|nr:MULTISPECIES: hypothetical protein [unclassified Streptomyces]